MNNETKEIKLILNIIKDVSEHKEGSRNGLMIMSCKDYKTLLDYITNLQQELEEEKRIEEADLHKIQSLEEENERLKQELVKIPRAKMEYDLELDDYKSRCEKASEILHNLNDTLPLDLILSEIEHSENILQNGVDSQ